MAALPDFTLHRPATAVEATALLVAHPDARILAGGTDLLKNLRNGLGSPSALVDVSGIAGFSTIAADGAGGLVLGAGVTLATLAADAAIAQAFPALAEAAAAVAAPAHRSVATLGGNLFVDTRCAYYNQSEWWRRANAYCLKHRGDTCHVAPQGKHCYAAYCGDVAPALLVLGASVDLVAPEGPRRLPLEQLHVDDGAHPFTLRPAELVTAIRIPPPPPGARSGYRKSRVRGAIDFPLAGVAASVAMREGRLTRLAVALTGTNSRPFLLEGTDALLGTALDDADLAALSKLVHKQAGPKRTTLVGAHYRRLVAAALASRLVAMLATGSR